MTTLRELITELQDIALHGGADLTVAICDIDGDIYHGPVWANQGGNSAKHIVYIDYASSEPDEENT